ncbi:MAG: FAD-binding protein [Gammaproteobacteria bacterium]|nr:FAD-binding protein [Gammaproteobacteria bacterium]
MGILVVAEHDQESLKPGTLNTVTAALEIGLDIEILVAGRDCGGAVKAASSIQGIKKVIYANNSCYEHELAETMAFLVAELGGNYTHVLAPATTTGKNYLPRVAALLNVAQISDIIEVKSEDTFVRPIYAGNAMATVQSSDKIKVITVRTTAFEDAILGEDVQVEVEEFKFGDESSTSSFIEETLSVSERPELTAASIIVSGGRGMQNGENFVLLEKLADKLNAAIGASRAAVDAGFVPNDYQVGQTGKIVAPDLYIAVGISGAIQHLAGMKDSKVIVAINKDEEAPIFQVADYGLVADLFTALPELEQAL